MSVILKHIQIDQSSGKSPIGLIELNRSLLFFCFLYLLFFFFFDRTVVITLATTSDRKLELASREHADNWDPCLFFSYQGPTMHDTTYNVVRLGSATSLEKTEH
jgi:hypothetical protein